ncbi:MAG: hypothetical protein NVS2B14_17030 [Chamaesiphon sp.]
MQLLDSLNNKLPVSSTDRLLDCLQDIVNNVQIERDFCVRHPSYKPLELPTEVAARFQQTPLELQNKYMSLQVRSFLYGIYYNGYLQDLLALDADSNELTVPKDLVNNTVMGVDLEFTARLHESNKGEGYLDPGWSIIRQETDGALAVFKEGLTLHIERDRHLESAQQSATVGELVAIRMPRNLVQNGFYMAVSNLGTQNHSHPNTLSGTVRIYFNLTPEGAIAVMESLTQQLNEIKLPFTFKVLYNPSDYGRYDSGVLYFEKNNYEAVRQVVQNVYTEHQSHFQPEVPLFTKLLAPGLSLAEEPDRKFSTQESFGMNRCQIVTNGLLEAWQKGDNSPDGRMASIYQHFSLLGIELQRPYLNANSEDIYTPFVLSK